MLLDASGRAITYSAESINNQIGFLQQQNHHLRETFRELELAMEEVGWIRMGQNMEKEFSPQGRRAMLQVCRMVFLKNPLVNRGVLIKSIYVWAQGCKVSSEDTTVQKTLDEFFQDPENERALTSHQARTLKEQELEVTGNLYFVLFTELATARTLVRSIPCEEVPTIICDPDDAQKPWYYLREWNQQTFDTSTGATGQTRAKAYYPDWQYAPEMRPEFIGGVPVNWAQPVYHVKVGGLPDMKFGVPEIYCVNDWAMAYKSFLEDFASISKALVRFAFDYNTKGGAQSVAAARTALNTTIGDAANGYDVLDRIPPPLVGSTFISSGNNALKPVKTTGATTGPGEAREMKLMVCAGFGFPESFFGDVSVGTLATAKSLDRPTELNILDRQKIWAQIYIDFGRFVVAKSSRAAAGTMFSVESSTAKITCTFPPILEHDITETVNAIAAAATLNGSAPAPTFDLQAFSTKICQVLEIPDADEVVKRIMEADAAAKLEAKNNPQPQQQPMVKALESLRTQLIEFNEKYPLAA